MLDVSGQHPRNIGHLRGPLGQDGPMFGRCCSEASINMDTFDLIMELLAKLFACLEPGRNANLTALMAASARGRTDVVRVLLDRTLANYCFHVQISSLIKGSL